MIVSRKIYQSTVYGRTEFPDRESLIFNLKGYLASIEKNIIHLPPEVTSQFIPGIEALKKEIEDAITYEDK